MTHNSSRKQFFAKLLGVVAATGVIPKVVAKPAVPAASAGNPSTSSRVAGRFEIRHDGRAVSRGDQA